VIEMERPLGVGTDQIKTLIIKMGQLSLEAISLAIKGFHEQEDVNVQIRAWSNTLLILSEEVEDRATELMALHQPMARDLRNLKAYIKVAYDMERFGRYAQDISDILLRIGPWEPFSNGELSVEEMGEKVINIVKLAVELIETRQQSIIWKLSETEAEIDELYLKNLAKLGVSKAEAKTVIAYLLTIRYLERIADHASYVAESVTYAETGKRIVLR
jgi:phosphate transport system protein